MRITIIPYDRFISVDGQSLIEIEQDWSWIPEDVHAVQWYHDHGEIEFTDTRPNEHITDLGIYFRSVQMLMDEQNRLEQEKIAEQLARESARDYWRELRQIRNAKLFECDWTQLPDSPLTEEKKQEWYSYRQQLRDLTGDVTEPKALVLDFFENNAQNWPIPPTM